MTLQPLLLHLHCARPALPAPTHIYSAVECCIFSFRIPLMSQPLICVALTGKAQDADFCFAPPSRNQLHHPRHPRDQDHSSQFSNFSQNYFCGVVSCCVNNSEPCKSHVSILVNAQIDYLYIYIYVQSRVCIYVTCIIMYIRA